MSKDLAAVKNNSVRFIITVSESVRMSPLGLALRHLFQTNLDRTNAKHLRAIMEGWIPAREVQEKALLERVKAQHVCVAVRYSKPHERDPTCLNLDISRLSWFFTNFALDVQLRPALLSVEQKYIFDIVHARFNDTELENTLKITEAIEQAEWQRDWAEKLNTHVHET
jgi:hypothetical protein